MSDTIWVVKDTQTGNYLTTYGEEAYHPAWGGANEAADFGTQAAADEMAESMNGAPGRFIGTNPPLH